MLIVFLLMVNQRKLVIMNHLVPRKGGKIYKVFKKISQNPMCKNITKIPETVFNRMKSINEVKE